MGEFIKRIESEEEFMELVRSGGDQSDITPLLYLLLMFPIALLFFYSSSLIFALIYGVCAFGFPVLRYSALSTIRKSYSKYHTVHASVIYQTLRDQETHAATLNLKLLEPREIPTNKKAIAAIRVKRGISNAEARNAEETINRIRNGIVKSRYTETSDHRHHILLVSYDHGISGPMQVIRWTRLGKIRFTATHQTTKFVGSYQIPDASRPGTSLRLLVFSVGGFCESISSEFSMPSTFECYFMVHNYLIVRLLEMTRVFKAAIRKKKELKEAWDRTLGDLRKLSEVTGKPEIIAKIRKTQAEEESKVEIVTFRRKFISFLIWVIGAMAIYLLGRVLDFLF